MESMDSDEKRSMPPRVCMQERGERDPSRLQVCIGCTSEVARLVRLGARATLGDWHAFGFRGVGVPASP